MISSIRRGFATNSSSSHSIVMGCSGPDVAPDYSGYGWDWFHLKDYESKRHYMLVLAYEAFKPKYNSALKNYSDYGEIADTQLRSIFGDDYDPEAYIDHQSQIAWPDGSDKDRKQFALEFAEYVASNDNISIIGGNDNCYEQDIPSWSEDYSSTVVVPGTGILRSYGDGNWVVFDPDTGNKTRFSLKGVPLTHSPVPELVDLKITDYCPHKCAFCYQDSTLKGQHADFDTIRKLPLHNVFEIAIGGGEPTLHPEFPKILRWLKGRETVVNFTSFNMDWADNFEISNAVNDHCGGFAISSLKTSELEKLKRWNESSKVKGNIQVPCGGYNQKILKKAVDFCAAHRIGITLLGYKTTGRGSTFSPRAYDWLLEYIMNHEQHWALRVGVDTLFVDQFRESMIEFGLDQKLFVGREGQFSCYIDAVEKTIGPDSFSPQLMKPISFGSYLTEEKELFVDFPFNK